MLFVEVTIYCITTFPFPITTVYGAVTMNMIKSKDHAAIDNFLTFLAGSILQYVNASTAMYSNLVTSIAFRDELKKLIMYCIKLVYHLKTDKRAPTIGTHINRAYDDGS